MVSVHELNVSRKFTTKAKKEIQALAKQYSREMVDDRAMDAEAQILEVMCESAAKAGKAQLSIKEITQLFVERHRQDYERVITTKWIGTIIRRRLHLSTLKSHGVFVISVPDQSKLNLLYQRYGVADSDEPMPAASQDQSISL